MLFNCEKVINLKYLLFVFLFFVVPTSLANTKNEIIWFTDDSNDLSDLLLDKPVSIGTDTLNLVLNELNQYRFDFQYASLARINKQLRFVDNACIGNRIKTAKRAKDNLFSLPVNIHIGLRIYLLNDAIQLPEELLNEQGQLISLTALFDTFPDKIFGAAKGRSFGAFLDNQIAQLPNKNVIRRPGDDRYNAISRLFLKRHIDFIIGFPIRLNDRIKQARMEDIVSSYEIAGNQNYILRHIACNKSEEGQRMIKDVNDVLKSLYSTEAFYNAHINYIPEMERASFNRIYKEIFQKNTFE